MPKVPYDKNSTDPLIKYCLQKKIFHAKHTAGIGPHSCCAAVELSVRGGAATHYVFGNSQLPMLIAPGIYAQPQMKCHGEASALMSALDEADLEIKNSGGALDVIQRVYVELSPCVNNCAPLLNNVRPGLSQTIDFSFVHPNEVVAWQQAATTLCSG